MFNQNDSEKKLDWMYKSANSLVEREDYLLGRSVDKSLEQLNEDERQKQLGLLPPPKNHVEHECIPPSIRDYKLQQALAEQVDLQAKLQEDPLLSIKKREEETRRQFLQNPVQLKKLQKALSKQEKKSKKKKRGSLDKELLEKLQALKDNPLGLELKRENSDKPENKKAKREKDLDIILMHKFNSLKSKLSEADLKDIMDGKITESEDSSSEDSGTVSDDHDRNRKMGKDKGRKLREHKAHRNKHKKRDVSESSSSSDSDDKKKRKIKKRRHRSSSSSSSSEDERKSKKKQKKHKKRNRSTSSDTNSDTQHKTHHGKPKSKDNKYDRRHSNENIAKHIQNRHENYRNSPSREDRRRNEFKKRDSTLQEDRGRKEKKQNSSTYEEERRRDRRRSTSNEDLRNCRNRSNSRDKEIPRRILGPSRPSPSYRSRRDFDDDEEDNKRITNWGLVTSDGTQIPLSKRDKSSVIENKRTTVSTEKKPEKYQRNREKLTDEEKQKRLKEMMRNAVNRDEERAKNMKRYREDEARERKEQNKDFNTEFAHKELLKSANVSTVESRIKANLNNIQRSRNDMNSHFSRRY